MYLVEVEIVGAETAQAGLACGKGPSARAAAQIGRVAHHHPELRREHDVVAARAERAAEQFFGLAAAAVNVGGIEERNALVEGAMDEGLRAFGVHSHPEVVAIESGDRGPGARFANATI